MQYKKLCINIPDSKADMVCIKLLECGISGYEVIDDKPVNNPYDWDYEELRLDMKDTGGITSVIFYLEDNQDEVPVVNAIKEDFPEAEIKLSISDEADWRDKWKDYFHSFSIGDILIKPSWEEVNDTLARFVIEIDPGISFGTGAHETTRMCIGALDEIKPKGAKVLDAGCGSGILSIAAAKLGAGKVTCVDIDPDCITTSKENIEKNNLSMDLFEFYCGDIMGDKRLYESLKDDSFDLVCANILADIIVTMLPALYSKVRSGGTLILSGIIDGKQDVVLDALKNYNLDTKEVKKDGEWYMIRCNKG